MCKQDILQCQIHIPFLVYICTKHNAKLPCVMWALWMACYDTYKSIEILCQQCGGPTPPSPQDWLAQGVVSSGSQQHNGNIHNLTKIESVYVSGLFTHQHGHAMTGMGLLPDTQNCGLRMCRECRERFPHHQHQRKPLVSDPGMHHGTCVTHVPWCMSGSLNPGGRENVPGIPGACTTRNFMYLVRDPYNNTMLWHRKAIKLCKHFIIKCYKTIHLYKYLCISNRHMLCLIYMIKHFIATYLDILHALNSLSKTAGLGDARHFSSLFIPVPWFMHFESFNPSVTQNRIGWENTSKRCSCWCPGYLHRQAINSHNINYIVRISTSCTIAYFNKSDVKHRNTLGCLKQYILAECWDCETVRTMKQSRKISMCRGWRPWTVRAMKWSR